MEPKLYQYLSDDAKKVMPQVELLLNGLTIKDVFEIARCLKDKAVEETKVTFLSPSQHP
jgi:hypothetical protein